LILITSSKTHAQSSLVGRYDCAVNKIDSYPDYYSLVLCNEGIYDFFLVTGRNYDVIGYESLSSGRYIVNQDTLILLDDFLNMKFKFLVKHNVFEPVVFFETFKKSNFHFYSNLDTTYCNHQKSSVQVNRQIKKRQINRNITGTYCDVPKSDLIRKNDRVYANYFYKINLNVDGTYQYWIYDNLVLKGTWQCNNGVLHLFDSLLNNSLTLCFNERGNLLPLRFLGSNESIKKMKLYKYNHNIELYKESSTIQIPDE
jgi:hypothetical protein